MAALARSALLVLIALAGLAGCLKLEAAHVPDRYLANGWVADDAQSDDEPASQSGGLARTQTLAYKDEARDDRGYPGTLTVITLRALVTPSGESLLEQVSERVREAAEARGIRIDAETSDGERTLASKVESSFFLYNGTVTAAEGLFTRNAKVKIIGEAWECRDERTAVVAVALAQVTDARSLGGVPFPSNNDPATWREIVNDPAGTIEGARGTSGLVYNVACS